MKTIWRTTLFTHFINRSENIRM